jgi:hypothetical protein
MEYCMVGNLCSWALGDGGAILGFDCILNAVIRFLLTLLSIHFCMYF